MSRIKGIGFSTTGGRDLERLDQTLAEIIDTGAHYAELSLYKAPVVINGHINTPYLDSLLTLCQRYPLGYSVHGPLCTNLRDQDYPDLHQQVVRAMIDVCQALNATILVVHGGRNPPQPSNHSLIEFEKQALKSLADYAQSRNVTLAVETLFDPIQETSDPQELAQILSSLNHPHLCATLDFSHAALTTAARGIDYLSSLETLAPWVNHLHVHDSFARPYPIHTYTTAERIAYGLGDLHLPLGKGSLPWETSLPKLFIRPQTLMIIELPAFWWHERHQSFQTARYYQTLFPTL